MPFEVGQRLLNEHPTDDKGGRRGRRRRQRRRPHGQRPACACVELICSEHRPAGPAVGPRRLGEDSDRREDYPRHAAPAPSPKSVEKAAEEASEAIADVAEGRRYGVHHRRHGRRHRHWSGAGGGRRSPEIMGILTVGIVTKPFAFEGKRRMEQAEKGISALREHVDSLGGDPQ